ncbi:MAG: TonB-dependent receptor family protein [Candidatus Symbiothrix sp.]|jgi:hypothetical protein|nr:TonB-dependent receptor family protein [Candidatus Symbiothrix sp.]
MKTFFLSIFLCFSGILNSFSQANTGITIHGQLVDSLSLEAIPFATAKIFSEQQKTTPLKVCATDENGYFKFESIHSGIYFLHFEFLGKNPMSVPVTIDDNKDLDLGKIRISDNARMLQEVVVSAQKSLVKVDMDKITYNMEEDPESKNNNVLEMLRKVPMVTVDGEENVQLKGSTNFKFYMNGKPSNLLSNNPKDVLRSIPANTIKNIEIITDPGAKYDAEGVTGIINIVTQNQSSLGGYTVSVNAGASSIGRYYSGAYFSLKHGKIGVTGDLNYFRMQNTKSEISTFRESFFIDNNHYLSQKGLNNLDGKFLMGYGEFSYEIDTLNLFTVNVSNRKQDLESNNNLAVLMENVRKETTYKYDQVGFTKEDEPGTTLAADYQRSFSVKDRLLTASYELYISTRDMDADTKIKGLLNFNDNWRKQFNNEASSEHTFQIDYTTPIAQIHIMETGAKFIKRINKSNSGMSVYSSPGEWTDIRSEGDKFEHIQDILAAYVGYSVKYKKWGFKVALQYTIPMGVLLSLNSGYSPPDITLQGEGMSYSFYGLSASKGLLNNTLNIRISANNLLRKNLEMHSKQRSSDFYYESFNYRPFRDFSLSISYRFGEMKSQIKKTTRGIRNDDQMQSGDMTGGSIPQVP